MRKKKGTGTVYRMDQSHLHGILDRIDNLGLKLVSVQDLSEDVHPSVERNRELVP